MKYEHLPGDLVTGVACIDRDHDQLFSLVNLFRTGKADRNLGVLQTVVMGLAEYTVYHFRKEEIGFDACGFKGAAGHEREHRLLEDTTLQLQSDLNEKPEVFDAAKLEEIDGFLVDWLGHHIKDTDMAFKKAFAASPDAIKAMEKFSFAGHLAEGIDDIHPLDDILGELEKGRGN